MEYIAFAAAGILTGGVIASVKNKWSIWITLSLGVLAALFLWLGMRASVQ